MPIFASRNKRIEKRHERKFYHYHLGESVGKKSRGGGMLMVCLEFFCSTRPLELIASPPLNNNFSLSKFYVYDSLGHCPPHPPGPLGYPLLGLQSYTIIQNHAYKNLPWQFYIRIFCSMCILLHKRHRNDIYLQGIESTVSLHEKEELVGYQAEG